MRSTQALPEQSDASNPLAAMQEAVRSTQRRADTLGVYRGNLSALDILTEISRRVPPDLDVVFEELSIDRQVIQIKGHSPSFGSVDRAARGARAVRALRRDHRRRHHGRREARRSELQRAHQPVRREGALVRELWRRVLAAYEGLSRNERLLVGVAGGLLALALFWFALVMPLVGAAGRAASNAAAAEQQLQAVRALRARFDEVHGRLVTVEQRIRSGPRGEIFTTLEQMAAESAVKIDSMEPRTSPASDEYRETKVQVALKGVTLAQLVDFLSRIDDAPQVLSIKSLRIRTRADKQDLLDVTFTVSSFEVI